MTSITDQSIILRAEKWVNNGFCIGFLDGETFFISGAIPGELVECEPVSLTKKFKHVKVNKVLEPSSDRASIDCDIFLLCGGCSFRHISYSNELEIKKNIFLKEYNHKFSNSPLSLDSIQIIKGNELHYRNNVQFKIQNNKKGFYKIGTNDLAEFPKSGCLNLPKELIQAITNFEPKSEKEIKLRFTNKVHNYEKEDSEFIFENKKFKIPKNGFFQINRYLIQNWLEEIILFLPDTNLNVLELFSGSGLISIFLASKCRSLVGYELEENAVSYAVANAKMNNTENVKFHVRNLYRDKVSQKHLSYPIWVMNPPRNGLGSLILEQIQSYQPMHILYSSCNYITLIQDLKKIDSFYKVTKVTIADFFPRTPYFETLVLLEKI